MDNVFDQATAMTRMWTDMMSKLWGVGMSWQPQQPPADAARALRNSMFQAMSQSFEEFMRSPVMMEWMKQSMDAATAWRKQWNEWLTRMRHEAQGTASQDIDSLMVTMRHMERRVLERLDELGERLENLTQRLDELEGDQQDNGETNGHSRRRRYSRGFRRSPKTSEELE